MLISMVIQQFAAKLQCSSCSTSLKTRSFHLQLRRRCSLYGKTKVTMRRALDERPLRGGSRAAADAGAAEIARARGRSSATADGAAPRHPVDFHKIS